jgi:hypothetical protein
MVAARSSSSTTAISKPGTEKNISTDADDDTLFDRKIEIASEGLAPHYYMCFYKIPLKENALTLAGYIISMK